VLPLLCLLLFFVGCKEREAADMDLSRAEQALAVQNIPDAEMYFQRYLRTHPDDEQRWRVWNHLLDIALNRRQEKSTARDYLEVMLAEFSNQPERRMGIQMSLAALCREMGDYTRAVALWEALAVDPVFAPADKAQVYRNLAQAYMRRLAFTQAANSLEACLELPVPDSVKADCLYDMADERMLTDNQQQAEHSLRALLGMSDVSPGRKVLATFMLADVLEQQGKYAEAKELFESIRDSYPNVKVIDLHLQFINRRMKK
jgi:tetratricopeptide (TPR) repeat protein